VAGLICQDPWTSIAGWKEELAETIPGRPALFKTSEIISKVSNIRHVNPKIGQSGLWMS
jgi:hypothetical protein